MEPTWSAFHFIDEKNSYGSISSSQIQKPSQTHPQTHCYSFNFSSWSPISSAYIIFWGWWSWFNVSSYFFPLLPPPTVLLWKLPCKGPSLSLLHFCSSFLLPLLTILRLLCVGVAVSHHRVTIRDVLAALLLWGRFTSVSVVVEVGEEDDESDGVTDQSPLHPGWEWAAGVEGVSSMANGHVELDLEMYTHMLADNT